MGCVSANNKCSEHTELDIAPQKRDRDFELVNKTYERLWKQKCRDMNVPVLNLFSNKLYSNRVNVQCSTE